MPDAEFTACRLDIAVCATKIWGSVDDRLSLRRAQPDDQAVGADQNTHQPGQSTRSEFVGGPRNGSAVVQLSVPGARMSVRLASAAGSREASRVSAEGRFLWTTSGAPLPGSSGRPKLPGSCLRSLSHPRRAARSDFQKPVHRVERPADYQHPVLAAYQGDHVGARRRQRRTHLRAIRDDHAASWC